MSNDNPLPGEFAPERLEELALETAVKIAGIRSDDAKDILFYMAGGFSLQEGSRDLRISEENLHKRFVKLFNNLELPFDGTHADKNKQAMWVVQRALQIADDDAPLQKCTASASTMPTHNESPPAPVVEPEVVLAEPEPEPEPAEEPEMLMQPEMVTVEPEPVSEPEVAEEVASAPEPVGAPALSEVADPEMERVMELIRAMPLDTNLRILAGYTFGGSYREIGEILGLTRHQVAKQVQAIRASFNIPQMSDHRMFGTKELNFLTRAFEGVYPNGLRELSEGGLAA